MDHERRGRRLYALDGLRGVAALVVVFHHVLLCDPRIAELSFGVRAANRDGWRWWTVFSPVHALWAGTEAVFVFFVLSGLVLVRPYLASRERAVDWSGYYAKRAVRLYAPVVMAVALALGWAMLVPRHGPASTSAWLSTMQRDHLTLGSTFRDVTLLSSPGRSNSVLWSLKWEVVFSLLLPLFVVAARWLRGRSAMVTIVVSLACAAGLWLRDDWLQYMPMFLAGAVMASTALSSPSGRVATWTPWRQWSAFAGAVALVTSRWLAGGWFVTGGDTIPQWAERVCRALSVGGAALLVYLCLSAPAVQAVFDRRSLQWLGSRSFSLYLVHEPLVVSVGFLLGPRPNVAVMLAICVPVSLVLAEVFWRMWERRTQRWAAVAGQRAHLLERLDRDLVSR
ncbi:MAG: acyltransferase family protein [Acidimicrobiia bacterium]